MVTSVAGMVPRGENRERDEAGRRWRGRNGMREAAAWRRKISRFTAKALRQ